MNIDEDKFEEILAREYHEATSTEVKEAILRIREQVKYITYED